MLSILTKKLFLGDASSTMPTTCTARSSCTAATLLHCFAAMQLVPPVSSVHIALLNIALLLCTPTVLPKRVCVCVFVIDTLRGLRRQKEAAAANRKDAKLKAVVISEAWDKKASKYNAPSVPFPYDSKSTYERSMRTPMGREFNTTATHRSAFKHSRLMPDHRYSNGQTFLVACSAHTMFW